MYGLHTNDPDEYNFNKVNKNILTALNRIFNNKLNWPNDICSVKCLLDKNFQWCCNSGLNVCIYKDGTQMSMASKNCSKKL